jgi:hypothetical protein
MPGSQCCDLPTWLAVAAHMETPSKAGINDIYIRIHVLYSKRVTLTAL